MDRLQRQRYTDPYLFWRRSADRHLNPSPLHIQVASSDRQFIRGTESVPCWRARARDRPHDHGPVSRPEPDKAQLPYRRESPIFPLACRADWLAFIAG